MKKLPKSYLIKISGDSVIRHKVKIDQKIHKAIYAFVKVSEIKKMLEDYELKTKESYLKMFHEGDPLAARNSVMNDLKDSLENKVEKFLFFNKGITVACQMLSFGQKDFITFNSPVVIDGKKTVVSIADTDSKALILIKFVEMPEETISEAMQAIHKW